MVGFPNKQLTFALHYYLMEQWFGQAVAFSRGFCKVQSPGIPFEQVSLIHDGKRFTQFRQNGPKRI